MNVAPSGSFLATTDFVAPPGSCDCHLHVFGPAALTMLGKLGLSRAVIVQATLTGTDNSRLISALAEFPLEARGVVALDERVDAATLRYFDTAGVRGARL